MTFTEKVDLHRRNYKYIRGYLCIQSLQACKENIIVFETVNSKNVFLGFATTSFRQHNLYDMKTVILGMVRQLGNESK